MRRLSTIPVQYVAALLLAVALGGGIYALHRSSANSATTLSQVEASAPHSATTVHRPTNNTTEASAPRIAAARPNGEASKSPKQILVDAASALRAARGYELQGWQTEGGQTWQLRVLASPRSLDLAAAAGTADYELLRVSSGVYVRGNASFWTQHLGQRGAILADRWIHGSSSALLSILARFEPATIARCLPENTGTLSIAGTTSVDGRPAILVRDAGNLPGTVAGTLAVATTGPPYPLQEHVAGRQRAGGRVGVCNDGHGSGYQSATLTLTNFNQVPPFVAPPDAIQSASPPVS